MSKITINQLHMALCEANSIMLTVHVRPDVMLPKIFGGFMRDTNCNFFHNVVSFG